MRKNGKRNIKNAKSSLKFCFSSQMHKAGEKLFSTKILIFFAKKKEKNTFFWQIDENTINWNFAKIRRFRVLSIRLRHPQV